METDLQRFWTSITQISDDEVTQAVSSDPANFADLTRKGADNVENI